MDQMSAMRVKTPQNCTVQLVQWHTTQFIKYKIVTKYGGTRL